MAAKKGQQEIFAPGQVDTETNKLGRLQHVVLDCINKAAGTAFPYTRAKIRHLKKIVQETPADKQNEAWWSGFLTWIYKANFEGRRSEVMWGADVVARNLDKYIDAYMNRERFAVTRYHLEQAGRDEWEVVLYHVTSGKTPQPPPWDSVTSECIKVVGGSSAIRSMRLEDTPRVRAAFVREWVDRHRRPLAKVTKAE